MAVDHGKSVFVVFGGHFAGGVRTEGADLVVEGGGVVYQLGFVEILIQEFHYLVTDFNADTDIDSADLGLDAVAAADVAEPVGAFAADGRYDLRGVVGLAFVSDNAFCFVVFNEDISHHGIEFHVDALSQ